MANQEHVQRLRQGVKMWNRWRAEHLDVQPDLSKADLSRANLSRANLSRANLREAALYRADLSFADLSETQMSFTDLTGASLSHANLTETNLQRTCLDQIILTGATLDRTDLRGIPWLLVMELTLQPGIVWEDVLYDAPQEQGEEAPS